MSGRNFRGGYAGKIAASNISLPSRIKCSRCGLVKNLQSYSKNQQLLLQQKIHRTTGFNAATEGVVPCTICTAAQQTEMQCQDCDQWKAKELFSKTQRRTPDTATCFKCMTARADLEPGGYSDDDIDDDSDSDRGYGSDHYSDDGITSQPGTMTGMSLRGGTSAGGVRLPMTSAGPSTGQSAASTTAEPAPQKKGNWARIEKRPKQPNVEARAAIGQKETKHKDAHPDDDIEVASSDSE
ncbi:hypothetical protein K470DRAFT_258918 [Piedraia hortae CBS 480.64]|uniref:Stc1 domain-containing protein n=1 Tax=Piedraia hortae CBS 480.64 TaxID=1314780 RepID=A0A6A7BW48_9PEZI|nr:hypothetical protein K470DRAFT_258918 [Piedraia hortae CBS 480.64]